MSWYYAIFYFLSVFFLLKNKIHCYNLAQLTINELNQGITNNKLRFFCVLTHFSPISHFYTARKRQKRLITRLFVCLSFCFSYLPVNHVFSQTQFISFFWFLEYNKRGTIAKKRRADLLAKAFCHQFLWEWSEMVSEWGF